MTTYLLFCCCLPAITLGVMWLTHKAMVAAFGPVNGDDK